MNSKLTDSPIGGMIISLIVLKLLQVQSFQTHHVSRRFFFCHAPHLSNSRCNLHHTRGKLPFQRKFVNHMAGSGESFEEDDDWFSDYDPSQYDTYNGYDDGYGNDRQPSYGGGTSRYGNGRSRFQNSRSRGVDDEYSRDLSRDQSNVDEEAVIRLLSERTNARRRRDFDTADAIRDQLLEEYSVGVFDKDMVWRTGCSKSGSGMGRARGGDRRRDGRQSGQRRPRDFGPNGHDYHPSPDMGPMTSELSEPEIHSMLAQRLEAKMSRRFDEADRIQSELITLGVFVHDGLKEWRADGVPFGDFSSDGRRGPSRTAGSRNDRNRPYQKSSYSPDVEGVTDSLINALVNERSRFKESRVYEKADAIREGLRTKYNVIVDDRLREWSVGGYFGEEHKAQRELNEAFTNRGYIKSGSSLPVSPEDEEYIQSKVDERYQAKRDRDFATADEIREELEETYNLIINDKLKLWSVGGSFVADGGPKKPRGSYTRRGGGDLSEEDVQTITRMLTQRYKAKQNRDFETADDIRDELRGVYNVVIDDKSSEWHVQSDEYVQISIPGRPGLPDEQLEKVQAMIEERTACKTARDYERADDIRDELRDNYHVLLDDRTKEWRYMPASDNSPIDPVDQQFVDESMASQSSAFERTRPDRELDDELDAIFSGDALDWDKAYESADDIESTGDFQLDFEKENSEDKEEEEAPIEVKASDESKDTEIQEDLSSLTVPALKEKLREAGLPVSGRKAELIERLMSA